MAKRAGCDGEVVGNRRRTLQVKVGQNLKERQNSLTPTRSGLGENNPSGSFSPRHSGKGAHPAGGIQGDCQKEFRKRESPERRNAGLEGSLVDVAREAENDCDPRRLCRLSSSSLFTT